MSDYWEEGKSRKEFKKRTVKSKAQIEALEEFYDEHKYITESMKEELAKSTGLTEKQVAGWFCHRRLKDKKSTNVEAKATGRPERSNGAAHDPGSGCRQDSCGSTKQEEERAVDLREAESKRSTYPESSAADINYELGSHHLEMAKHSSSAEDTSSGSGSSLRNTSLSHQRNHFTVDASRNQVNNLPHWMTECKPRPGPSGYLKIKGQVENAAITAVKRNLGRLYRTDGPQLGVDFDPIPPGAFGSHVAQVLNGPYFAEEPALNHSPEVSLGQRHHNSGPGYRLDSGIRSHKSERDGARFKRARGYDHPEIYYRENSNTKSPKYSQRDIYQARGSSTDIYEGSVRRARGYESWDVDQKASHDIGTRSLDPVSGHNQSLFDAKVSRKQPKPWLRNQKTMRSRGPASGHLDSSRLNLTSERDVYDDIKAKGLPRRKAKETKRPAEEVAVNEDFDPVQPEFMSKNEMTAAKRVKGEYYEDYGSKKPYRNEMTTAAKRVKVEPLEDYGSKIPYQNGMMTAAKRVKSEHLEDFGTKKPYHDEMTTAANRIKGGHCENYGMKKPFRNEKTGWASQVPRPAAEVPSSLNDDDVDGDDDAEEEEEEEEEEEQGSEEDDNDDTDNTDDETSSDN